MTSAPKFDVAQLTRLRRCKSIAVAPDQTWIAVEVARLDADEARYRSELWRVSLVDSAAPVRLTRGETSDGSPCFRRDGALGFLSNRARRPGAPEPGEGDRRQVWILPANGGEPEPITDEPLGVSDYRFAIGGDRLVVIAPVLPGVAHADQRRTAADRRDAGPTGIRYTRMPIRFWDHWIEEAAPHVISYSQDGGERRDLTPSAERDYRQVGNNDLEWDLSPDGRRVALARGSEPGSDRIQDMCIHLIDCESGEIRELGAVPRRFFGGPLFSPDSRRLACWMQLRQEKKCGRQSLWLFDSPDDRAGRAIATSWDAWPNPQAWTADGAAVIVTADDRGCAPVFRVDVATGEVARITSEASGGAHDAVRVVGKFAIGLRHRLLHPAEPFRVELAPGAAPKLLAQLSGFSEADGAAIATVESFSVRGDGGADVQSFLVRPVGARRPTPALLWIHGGPIGQNTDGWHWRWNPLLMAAEGYTVALPNPRGSTGFGQEFIEGIWNNEWGGACYRDLMAVADALAERSDVDRSRISAMGGSFGGYMANWIGASTDRFRALVTHAGVYHLPMFHGTTDHPPWYAHEMGGVTPDSEEFSRYSPHRGLSRWKTPTLIIHGERDYRVPVSEALMLFEDLQRHGVDSELLLFPDENHWILRPRNTRLWYRTVLDFLASRAG